MRSDLENCTLKRYVVRVARFFIYLFVVTLKRETAVSPLWTLRWKVVLQYLQRSKNKAQLLQLF